MQNHKEINTMNCINRVIGLINSEIGLFKREDVYNQLDANAQRKKRDKEKYSKMPKYWRAFFFFCYRYFYKLGFLDGVQGFLWKT